MNSAHEKQILTQVYKHLGHAHELQRLGYKVHVNVFRLSEEKGRTLAKELKIKKREEQRHKAVDEAVPLFQLRAQRELEIQSFAEEGTSKEALMRRSYVYPKGGFVRVEMENPLTGQLVSGEGHFDLDTVFVKKTALRRAFGKMFGKLLESSSMGRRGGLQEIQKD